jgi:anti-sigma regulatory factor (Ser/Thr protein kinase)
VSKDKEFTASPENEEEAVQVSRAIYDFCLQHEVSSKSASVLSLAVEELAVNTVRYGFSEGRTNIIDIRLIIKDDELIMSIRDNSKMFDPKKFYEAVCDDTDKTKNVGIRAAMGLASDITYTTTLKLNNLTMRMPIVV